MYPDSPYLPNNIYNIFNKYVYHLYLQYIPYVYNSTKCPRSAMFLFTRPYKVSALCILNNGPYKVTVYHENTSLILICCNELSFIGKFTCQIWRIFFDDPLSMVLTKLELIHEKLIRLNVNGLMKITYYMNWISIV